MDSTQHFTHYLQHCTNSSLTLAIIWAQVAAELFLLNPRWWPFKIKEECPAHQCKSNFFLKFFIINFISSYIETQWNILCHLSIGEPLLQQKRGIDKLIIMAGLRG
jgi:hypothetical protein